MRLVERKGTIDGFEWRCRVQSKENPHFVCRSVRKGTWFSDSRLSICVILRLTRRYIKNFAKRALPLKNLLRNDFPFEWTSERQEAFDDIKEAILNPPVLALPDPNTELQITTDASSRGSFITKVS
ncbi:transposon Tf2-9 polyprotein [Trichonephila clavipes]|nr:transposon Tf2-9 polyprotein [Trichonephila clavipes]